MRKGKQSKNLIDERARTTGSKKTHRLSTAEGPFEGGNPFQHAAREAGARTMDRQMLRESKNPFGAAMERAAKSDKAKVAYRTFNDPDAYYGHPKAQKKSRPTKIDAKRRKSLRYIQD